MADTETRDSAEASVAADLADERLIQSQGLSGYLRAQATRLRSGDLGNLPVIIGLVVICFGFYLDNVAVPVVAQHRVDHPVRRPDRHHRARHRAGAAARPDRPVGRVGERHGGRGDGRADGQPGDVDARLDARRDPHRRGRRAPLRAVVHAHRRAVVRVLARGAARLPGRAALRARRQRHDQPAQRLLPAGVHAVQLRHRLGVVRDRAPDRRGLPGLAVADQPAAQGSRARAAVVADGADQGGAARGRPGLPHLLRQHRPRLQLPVVAVLRHGGRRRLRAAPHRLGTPRLRRRRQRRGGPALRHQGRPGVRVGVRAHLHAGRVRWADRAPGSRPASPRRPAPPTPTSPRSRRP